MKCPKCGSCAVYATDYYIYETERLFKFYLCTDPDCAHTWTVAEDLPWEEVRARFRRMTMHTA